MSTTPASYLDHSDSLPGADDEFASRAPGFQDIKVHTLNESVTISLDDGTEVSGYLTYTEGLAPTHFEFELVGLLPEFPGFDYDDTVGLRGSASMIALGIPHLVPVGLSPKVLAQLEAVGLPSTARVQVLLDEASLDMDQATTYEGANWVADGGLALFDEHKKLAVIHQFFHAVETHEQERIVEIQDSQREDIEKYGWTCVGVFDPEGLDTTYVYTVGLSRKKLPELFISGLFDTRDLTYVISQVGRYYLEVGEFFTKVFERQVTIEIDGKAVDVVVRTIEVDASSMVEKYLKQASALLGEEVSRVAWVQFSDSKGRFPHDEGFDNTFQQPISIEKHGTYGPP